MESHAVLKEYEITYSLPVYFKIKITATSLEEAEFLANSNDNLSDLDWNIDCIEEMDVHDAHRGKDYAQEDD